MPARAAISATMPIGRRKRRTFDRRAGGAELSFVASPDVVPVGAGMPDRPKVFQVEYLFRLEYICQMISLSGEP
jgi:hypothetical protein